MAGGNPTPIDPRMLMDTSKTLTGGDLWNYLTSYEERVRRANQLFDWIKARKLTIPSPTVFRLSEGRQAHELIESRKSAGKIILIP
jgi:NADPH2:quinone reductase